MISINQWLESGLTYNQFRVDSRSGFLKIHSRGINGETKIDARSIKRPDRRRAIESHLGRIETSESERSPYRVDMDVQAREFYVSYRSTNGDVLEASRVTEYTNRASIFNALRTGMQRQVAERARCGQKLVMGEFWKQRLAWYTQEAVRYNVTQYSNVRGLERAFKAYLKDGYVALIHGNGGNDAARKVSADMEALFMSLWCGERQGVDMPFVDRVYRDYCDFLLGKKDLFDKKTGEILDRSKYKPVSRATVWNYLKRIDNLYLLSYPSSSPAMRASGSCTSCGYVS